MPYPTVNGVPLTDIFDPYVSGTKAIVTGYTVMVGGVPTDLKDLFAPIYLGTSAGPTKYHVYGADLNTLFAAKGSVSYSLPINGQTYTDNSGRGTASLALNVKSDGTYTVVNHLSVVLASGTWLPSGDSVSNWTALFTSSGFTNGPDVDGGNNSFTNGAPTQQALTTTRTFFVSSSAITVGTNASNYGFLTLYLYRLGLLRLTTYVTFDVSAAG